MRQIDWTALGVDDAIKDLDGFGVFLGDDLDAKTLITAAAEIAKGGADKYAAQQAADAKQAADKKGADAGIAADDALADALAKFYVAKEGTGDAGHALPALEAIVNARRAAVRAAPSSSSRAAACAAAVQKAVDALAKRPTDRVLAANLRAWQEVCAGVAPAAASTDAPAASSSLASTPPGEGPSFLTKKYWGVPAWGLGLGGAAFATGLAFGLRALVRR